MLRRCLILAVAVFLVVGMWTSTLVLIRCSFAFTNLSVDQVKAKIDAKEDIFLLDVREPHEFESGYIQGAINLPWTSGVLRENYVSLPNGKPIVVICQSGGRSASASAFLEEQGFDQILNMTGGMNAWKYDVVTGQEQGVAALPWGTLKAIFR